MIRTISKRNGAPARGARQPSLEELFFKMGGFTGAVRRVTARWHRPFNANQVKIAIVRRHLAMIPSDTQIENILEVMAERGRLIRLGDGTYQKPCHLKEAA